MPESESLLVGRGCLQDLASRKVVWRDPCIEVSGTAKLCTDEQELHMRHGQRDESYETRSKLSSCLCMEQNTKGWMGSSTKSYTYYYHNIGTVAEERV